MKGLIFLGLCVSSICVAQKTDSLSIKEIETLNFTKRLPIAKKIINVKKDLFNRNMGQDLPILLGNQTSFVSTSDAGNGVGYTGMRVRGIDGSRINVMINRVPYNDSESQGTFFVNISDLVNSASNIVIQRGVGTSSNGVSSFGASVNIITQEPTEKTYFGTEQSFGSFDTRKHSFEVSSGALLDGKLSLMGRHSIIKSNGYLERAFSDLKSYNITAVYKENDTKLKLWFFGGKEKTYQAWNGITKEQIAKNRRYNSAGAIYSTDWNKIINFYNNETDNYQQNHYHLVWEQSLSNRVKTSTTLHYTNGKGYYENFKQSQKLSKYALPEITIGNTTIKRMDLIQRKWLDNKFYGIVSELNLNFGKSQLDAGVIANQYYGKHFGQVYRGQYHTNVSQPHEYYRNHGIKDELSGYAKAIHKVGNWELFGDLQLRIIHYRAHTLHGTDRETIAFDNNYTFFNPKAGINYLLEGGKLYFSYAQANREPKRSDIIESKNSIKTEKLHDFELGIQKKIGIVNLDMNAYYMLYKDQLILNGKLNDVGSALHENVKNSYRLGLELSMNTRIHQQFTVDANTTLSDNQIKNYQYFSTSNNVWQNFSNTKITMSPSFIGNLTLSYLPTKYLQFSLSNKYVGSQFLDNTQRADRKLEAYTTSDFVASYTISNKEYEMNVNFLLNNIFNKKYSSNGYVYNDPNWVNIETSYFYPQAEIHFMLGISLKIR